LTKLLESAPDGGIASPVTAYFLFESKYIGSIAVLRFNKGGREAYHTHAFNALTWFLWGLMKEHDIDGTLYVYSRSLWPKLTRKAKNHKVQALTTSWCLTVRGPWEKTWTEHLHGVKTRFTWGRTVLPRD
jgi:hypothetical protein